MDGGVVELTAVSAPVGALAGGSSVSTSQAVRTQ